MEPQVYAVRRHRQELDDTTTLDLAPLEGGCITFLPGQFTMLGLPGIGEIPISISGNPDEPGRLTQTIRAVGSVSAALAALQPDARVLVRGPFGRPWPTELAEGKRLLIVAGGLGLAPVRPIVYWALANRGRLAGVDLLYGARSPDNIPYGAQLLGWLASERLNGSVIVDRHAEEWAGPVGPVTELIGRSNFDPASTIAMICGPEIMMRFVIMALEARGLPDTHMWVSMERNMKCGVGWCGHCQMGPYLLCRDGPVFRVDQVRTLMTRSEL
ncbi:MAG: FAD/NAD(P)-binding protein [Alphaproteobacteria bacterium]